ncbi:MAG TPA: hypothetical protein VH257_14540 [Chloroflexota bacterium]|nr:hypothetical protein [Chloroflexota bacterium]
MVQPDQVGRLAGELRTEPLAGAAAETAIKPALEAFFDLVNTTPHAEVLASLEGLPQEQRLFDRLLDPDGVVRPRFATERFDWRTVLAALEAEARRRLEGPGPDSYEALARWVLVGAIAGVLTEATPPHARLVRPPEGALLAAFERAAGDAARGLKARTDALRDELPTVLATRILASWSLPERGLVEAERLLGLRPPRPRGAARSAPPAGRGRA